jgi:beta-galactosidase
MQAITGKTVRLMLLSFGALSLITPSSLSAQVVPPAVRQRLLMDADWRFQQIAPVSLEKASPITEWRWRPVDSKPADADAKALATTGTEWKTTNTGKDVFGGRSGFAWFSTTLPALPGNRRMIQFAGVDDNATVYLNGIKLLQHEGYSDAFEVPLDTAWNASGTNVLTVLVENTAGAGGITDTVTFGLHKSTTTFDFSDAGFDDRSWRTVHLPHDYVIEGTFSQKGDASHGSLIPTGAWYRKTFTLPASDKGKALWLDFDGIYRDSVVYLNGQKLGEHPCGYTPFHYDISRVAKFGNGSKNVLSIQVNAQKQEGWWYEGGGIYRHVWLTTTDPVHIAPWGTFVTTKLPEPTADKPATQATVTVKTTLAVPEDRKADVDVICTVLDPKGKVVGSATKTMALSAQEPDVQQQITVAQPALWSVEAPNLYRLHTEIRQAGRIVDSTETPFGIRTIRFDAEKGFFLNGKPVKIKGTCNHQDFIGVGVAMPDSLLTWRVKKLKEMGSNAYRMSHNPPSAELLDACDRLGMLVMDENRHLGDTEAGKASANTPYADLHEVESMVLRDRNHPSIIQWSMCNEEGIQGSAHGADIFRAMKAAVDKLDGTRPVTAAMNGGYESTVGISTVADVQGINYNPGAYDRFHKMHPEIPLYGSETASAVGARGIYDWTKFDRYYGDPAKFFVSAFDVNAPPWAQTAEVAWHAIAERPFVAGGYVWTGFDYKGEPTPFVWPEINSNFGIMDMCGFPKDSYYYYKAWWGDKPVVHLLPHWNWAGQEGQKIRVWVYGNGDKVELFLNGKSLGDQEMPRNGHLEWEVPYAAGTLEARSYTNGKPVVTDKVETTSAPVALRLTTDRTKLTADGEDITMVEVNVVDAKGRIVPTADSLVSFSLTGAGVIRGVGNGDPTCHEPDQASTRSAFKGKCMVLVGANYQLGAIRLTASAPGLKSATLNFEASQGR